MEFGKQLRERWTLHENIKFLNHGSFGAVPADVIDYFIDLNKRFEREPLYFLLEEYPRLLAATYEKLAPMLGASAGNLVMVENATTGFNTILANLRTGLSAGDEIIISDHVYPAVRNALVHLSKQTGIVIREAPLAIPFDGPAEIVDGIVSFINDSTRLLVIDHITSPSAAIFPIDELTGICRQRNIISIIDGAHAPGQIELDLDSLGADFYTGNCHKWLFAPKGSAFVWVAPPHQEDFHPLVISNDYSMGFKREFEWTGTRNPTAWLATAAAIDFYNALGGDNIRNYCHNLALEAAALIQTNTGAEIIAPAEMTGSMVSFCLPRSHKFTGADAAALSRHFYHKYKVEVPFMNISGEILFRISAQVYNYLEEYEYLCAALLDFIRE